MSSDEETRIKLLKEHMQHKPYNWLFETIAASDEAYDIIIKASTKFDNERYAYYEERKREMAEIDAKNKELKFLEPEEVDVLPSPKVQ